MALFLGARVGGESNGKNVPKDARIRCQACNRDADVVVDAEHLLLVRGQLTTRTLDVQGRGSGGM